MQRPNLGQTQCVGKGMAHHSPQVRRRHDTSQVHFVKQYDVGQLLGMLSYHELFGFLPGDPPSDSYVWVVCKTNVFRTLCEDPAVFLEDDEQWCEPQSDTIGRVQPLLLTINAAKSIVSSGATKEPGTLMLVRHGESIWNRNKTFTGWSDDADLTDQGTREMEHAARLLMEPGYEIDIVFTSRLKRAIRSTARAQSDSLTGSSWRINERH
jgi:hypothetical protein